MDAHRGGGDQRVAGKKSRGQRRHVQEPKTKNHSGIRVKKSGGKMETDYEATPEKKTRVEPQCRTITSERNYTKVVCMKQVKEPNQYRNLISAGYKRQNGRFTVLRASEHKRGEIPRA